jgi:tetratricopeptide (TPR) repeat protein
VLVERGRSAEAEDAFGRAVREGASDSLTAALDLALLHWRRGDRDVARRALDHFIDVWNERRARLTAPELVAVGTAVRILGADDPQLFKDALEAYDAAIAADPRWPEPRVLVGELFLEKYNAADAQRSFDEALTLDPNHPRALLGVARRRDFDGQPDADSLLRRALAVSPDLVAARAFSAERLLLSGQPDSATAEARRAVAMNPEAVDAIAVLAAARWLAGDRAELATLEARARAVDPKGATFDATLADIAAKNRRYREAARFARQGIARDPRSWRSHGLLGMNLLRLGQADSARASLERAFAGDPYDVWIKNTLDLLDTYRDYAVVERGRFQFLIERKDTALLAPLLESLGAEAWGKMARRYGWEPAGTVRVELYRSHADFSVRTVGLAGLGALGVSFGDVLVLDGPAAREPGEFNWGSTFWHELAHTFSLGLTDNRVPRWLSEGLAVWEERQARPGWGFDVSPAFLMAWRDGRLAPVSHLDDGFMRPRFPEQVQLSYVQAALVCEMIAAEQGDAALVAMLQGYRRGLSTDQVVRQALGMEPAALDARFARWLETRYARELASLGGGRPRFAVPGPGQAGRARGEAPSLDDAIAAARDERDFVAQLTAGALLERAGRGEEAVPYLERAKGLFPEYAGNDSPRWLLARIHQRRGDLRRAADELAGVVAVDERHLEAHRMLADVRERLGDRAGAADALERAVWIWPYDRAAHERLATLSLDAGRAPQAVRARRAVLALDPPDRAGAHYELARALDAAGEVREARREVLAALELAPSYEAAQTLLLELRKKGENR